MKEIRPQGVARIMCRHRRKAHKIEKVKKCLFIVIIFFLIVFLYGATDLNKSSSQQINNDLHIKQSYQISKVENDSIVLKQYVEYIPLDVPDINSSWKRWMDYRKITNKNSSQYAFVDKYGWCDKEGFIRYGAKEDIASNDKYYMIALGSYYGTDIGTKYKITTSEGNIFYGVLAECKSDTHTNKTHQYTNIKNPDIVEFLVDSNVLNKEVKKMGNADVYAPLKGKIVKIERIDYVSEV